ncbi:MAG TPA: hypothetical protein VFK56_21795, partial [Mycobacterium sp.]|nr:hypothetical protein [Mycobacterium sp.]
MSEPQELEADAPARPDPLEAEPTDAPDQGHYLKRWTFVAVLVAVWIPAAAIGVGLYYWWFHTLDKSWPVFVVLIFVAVCILTGLLAAPVDGKPLLSAFALASMAAPLAAV